MPQLDLFIGIQQFTWIFTAFIIFFFFIRFFVIPKILMNERLAYNYKKYVIIKLINEHLIRAKYLNK